MGAALAFALDDDIDLPDSIDWSRYAAPVRPAPVIIDHEPMPGIAPGAMAIAMACWLMGWRVLRAAFGAWAIMTAVDIRVRLTRASYSLRTAYAVGGVGWGAFLATIVLAVWR